MVNFSSSETCYSAENKFARFWVFSSNLISRFEFKVPVHVPVLWPVCTHTIPVSGVVVSFDMYIYTDMCICENIRIYTYSHVHFHILLHVQKHVHVRVRVWCVSLCLLCGAVSRRVSRVVLIVFCLSFVTSR